MTETVTLIDLGGKSYAGAYDLQMELVEQRANNSISNSLLFVEHPPVITMGRGGNYDHLLLSQDDLRKHRIELMETNRGGDIAYHGPGQLVGYPILQLSGGNRDLHQLARNYEEVIILALAYFAIEGVRIDGHTGVWVQDKKIAAIGIGVRNWVTFHGFALNVNVDLTPFSFIVPCGLKNKGVTSMNLLLERQIEMAEVKETVADCFGAVFNVTVKRQ